ncbi:aminoacyl-tRNA hydrolase [Undibacterium sp. Ren11W]|uniref:aminoacyl-tRNA hydrolase n=1 Tax=Undibacterium sp. Ren11W TaxID=3413045 RepID=UPI003BEFC071
MRLKDALAWRWQHLSRLSSYQLTYWHRRRLRNTVFIGVTGSAGKTTTKDLIASILQVHLLRGTKNPDSLNFPEDMVKVLLATSKRDAYCVMEISAHAGPGMLDLPLALLKPQLAVVTNIGSDHLTAYHSRQGIADEKARLVRALPADGVAILNADDPLVWAMHSQFSGRCLSFGESEDAMLRGDTISSVWPARLTLNATWQGQTVQVKTQLCGSHWAPAVLAALACGVALGAPLQLAAEALELTEPFEGRMAPVQINGIHFIRDDWKAPLSTVAPAFDFMRTAHAARKIIVIGTISDYTGDSSKRYVEIAKAALAIAACVVFVGPRASAALRAKSGADDALYAFPSLRDAATFLRGYLQADDLVLLKGSHKADHMQRLIIALQTELLCWRADCGYMRSCQSCQYLQVPSGPKAAPENVPIVTAKLQEFASDSVPQIQSEPDMGVVSVIGLGNPQLNLADTPHNVGYRALEWLAQQRGWEWQAGSAQTLIANGEVQGLPVRLIKLACPMNEVGPLLCAWSAGRDFAVARSIIVHDDLDLPFAQVRAKLRGGDGGHRGVRSILQSFQDDRFLRVKIGVGQPDQYMPLADFVLTPFSQAQQQQILAAHAAAADRVLELIRNLSTAQAKNVKGT